MEPLLSYSSKEEFMIKANEQPLPFFLRNNFLLIKDESAGEHRNKKIKAQLLGRKIKTWRLTYSSF